jgi:4-hydroxy-3-methylbut-2-enyl diphosphate reductase
MEVLLAEEFGFCFGVERAVEMVEDALDEGVRPIRSLGPLIHNAQEMERLGALGVSTIDEPAEADADTIAVIRAHGVTPQVQKDLEGRAAKVIDATCPFVTRVQHLAERAAKEGRDVVVAGNPDHPEMIGVVGYAPNNTYVATRVKSLRFRNCDRPWSFLKPRSNYRLSRKWLKRCARKLTPNRR